MTDKLSDNRDIDLLGYPFDQYQRYQDIQLVVDTIRSHEQRSSLRILDVGGTPLSKTFLPNDSVVTTNLELGSSVQLQSDGTRLALADRSFDVVLTCDTIEHIPFDRRPAFIAELLRVSQAYTIITGPFSNGFNEAAETALSEFLTNVVGFEHRFLNEHLQNGLPSLDGTLDAIARTAAQTIIIPSGYIQHWLPLMIIKHDLWRIAGGQAIADELDRYYNYTNYWHDHRLPSYRQIVVAAQSAHTAALDPIQRAFDRSDPKAAPDLNGVLAMWQALRWSTVLKDRAETLNRLRAEYESKINQLRSENQQLTALVAAYRTGRFIRFMAAWKQLVGAIFNR